MNNFEYVIVGDDLADALKVHFTNLFSTNATILDTRNGDEPYIVECGVPQEWMDILETEVFAPNPSLQRFKSLIQIYHTPYININGVDYFGFELHALIVFRELTENEKINNEST